MRNTMRRGPPKINSHKLPSAFGLLTNPNKKNKLIQLYIIKYLKINFFKNKNNIIKKKK